MPRSLGLSSRGHDCDRRRRREGAGVEAGRIAKTLTVRAGDHFFSWWARGDARLDNRKCKDEFGARPRMLGAEETFITGHPVGGVSPFGLRTPLPIYLDVSLHVSTSFIRRADR